LEKLLKDNKMVSSMAMLDVASNKIHAETMTMFGPRWANLNEFHSNWNFDHFEGSAKVGRFLGKFQWALPYAGFRVQKIMKSWKDKWRKIWGWIFMARKPGSDSRRLQKADIHL
jgi:hypothetical protein